MSCAQIHVPSWSSGAGAGLGQLAVPAVTACPGEQRAIGGLGHRLCPRPLSPQPPPPSRRGAGEALLTPHPHSPKNFKALTEFKP